MPSIPPLAGLCSYEDAARLGYSVDQNVQYMLRYAWIEKGMMEAGLYWLNPTPEWEVKEAYSLHAYQDAEHASMLRRRIGEMRNPIPRMDISPDAALDRFLNELFHAQTTLEKLVGLYGVLKPALAAAYRGHYAATNPLVDHPTRRMLRIMLLDEEDALQWGNAALAALTQTPETKQLADRWAAHLTAYMEAAGGISGEGVRHEEVPPPRAQGEFKPDFFPQRDDRFTERWNFVFPPHEVVASPDVSADEKTLALMCKRALEMDVPEAMARMIAEAKEQPWDYYVDMCRQLWDEARHAMMGEVYFEADGIDWRGQVALNTGFSIRLNQYMAPLEAHAILYDIEQSLMAADVGKKFEWETTRTADKSLATLFQDYDWADEVLHVHIGRRWLLGAHNMSRDEVLKLAERPWVESRRAISDNEYQGEQRDWWGAFVRQVLGTESTFNATPHPAQTQNDASG